MKGYPKTLNTKEDYLYVKEHFDRSQWLPEFQKLLDTRFGWFFEKHLDKESDGINDDTHKVVTLEIDSENPTAYDQYEYRENPQAKIFQLGFTVEEVSEIIKV